MANFRHIRDLYFSVIMVMATGSAFGAVVGDVDGSKDIDLKDTIISLQVCADLNPSYYLFTKL